MSRRRIVIGSGNRIINGAGSPYRRATAVDFHYLKTLRHNRRIMNVLPWNRRHPVRPPFRSNTNLPVRCCFETKDFGVQYCRIAPPSSLNHLQNYVALARDRRADRELPLGSSSSY